MLPVSVLGRWKIGDPDANKGQTAPVVSVE
jgi:hypothetical protein